MVSTGSGLFKLAIENISNERNIVVLSYDFKDGTWKEKEFEVGSIIIPFVADKYSTELILVGEKSSISTTAQMNSTAETTPKFPHNYEEIIKKTIETFKSLISQFIPISETQTKILLASVLILIFLLFIRKIAK